VVVTPDVHPTFGIEWGSFFRYNTSSNLFKIPSAYVICNVHREKICNVHREKRLMSFLLQSLQFCSKKLYQAPSSAHVVNADWPMERNSIGHTIAKQLPSTWLGWLCNGGN